MRLGNSVGVMVAGGAGFVGSAVARELMARGIRTVVYDNFFRGRRENLPSAERLTVIDGDARDRRGLVSAMRSHRIDHVINCVGDTFVPEAYEVPWRFFENNLAAAFEVLMAAEECGVRRVLYVSSTEVYGICTAAAISETAPLNPVNSYAVSKLAADRLCYTLQVERGLPVVIARIFNCYGPRETHPYVIPEIIMQLERGPVVRLGNHEAERDFTYVEDTARALLAVLESDLPDGDVVNVGTGRTYRIDWLARRLAELAGVGEIEIQVEASRLRRLDIDRFCCDNRKLVQYTGWTPTVSIDEGLRKTIEWFRGNRSRWPFDAAGLAG